MARRCLVIPAALAASIRELASDDDLLWNVARKAIEDELVDFRDRGLFVLRNNGFTIRYEDGADSSIIRFGPEFGVRIALKAIADHLDRCAHRYDHDGLQCTRPEHADRGHTYESTSGVPDRHDRPEGMDS